MQKVTNTIRDSISPDVTMFTECNDRMIDGKQVLVVSICQGTSRPYYLAGKGIRQEGVFVRHGSSAVCASNEAILKMIKESSNDCYEDALSFNQNLTFKETEEYFKTKNFPLDKNKMQTLRIINQDKMFTNLGLLLSDQCPLTIKIAIFQGSNKTIFKERKEFTGSILLQLQNGYNFLEMYNRTRAEFKELNRIDILDYPEEAIRETLLNAIVHRDYSFSSSSLISIFDDRMEFITIGGLIKGVSLNDIMLGISVLRNQHLSNILYRLKLIEAYGTGIQKIKACYSDCKIKPTFEVSDNAFKVILPNINYLREQQEGEVISTARNVSKRSSAHSYEDMIISTLNRTGSITRKDLQATLNISQAMAILILRKLIKKGILIKIGAGKNTCYLLKKKYKGL